MPFYENFERLKAVGNGKENQLQILTAKFVKCSLRNRCLKPLAQF